MTVMWRCPSVCEPLSDWPSTKRCWSICRIDGATHWFITTSSRYGLASFRTHLPSVKRFSDTTGRSHPSRDGRLSRYCAQSYPCRFAARSQWGEGTVIGGGGGQPTGFGRLECSSRIWWRGIFHIECKLMRTKEVKRYLTGQPYG